MPRKKGLSLQVHHIIQHPEKGAILSRVTPYVRLSRGSEKIFLQGGQVFWEGGEAVPHSKWPDWLDEELGYLGEKVLEEVGFREHVQNLNAKQAAE